VTPEQLARAVEHEVHKREVAAEDKRFADERAYVDTQRQADLQRETERFSEERQAREAEDRETRFQFWIGTAINAGIMLITLIVGVPALHEWRRRVGSERRSAAKPTSLDRNADPAAPDTVPAE
jgi:hypothetical protein